MTDGLDNGDNDAVPSDALADVQGGMVIMQFAMIFALVLALILVLAQLTVIMRQLEQANADLKVLASIRQELETTKRQLAAAEAKAESLTAQLQKKEQDLKDKEQDLRDKEHQLAEAKAKLIPEGKLVDTGMKIYMTGNDGAAITDAEADRSYPNPGNTAWRIRFRCTKEYDRQWIGRGPDFQGGTPAQESGRVVQ